MSKKLDWSDKNKLIADLKRRFGELTSSVYDEFDPVKQKMSHLILFYDRRERHVGTWSKDDKKGWIPFGVRKPAKMKRSGKSKLRLK